MGVRNYLVEGVSGTGKTSVCRELRRRGYDAVNGDTDLAYQGDPMTGRPTDTSGHEHHLWDVRRVRELAADRGAPVTFFCGGSRNFADFIDLFDDVFVLEVDLDTLLGRLDRRVGEFADHRGDRPRAGGILGDCLSRDRYGDEGGRDLVAAAEREILQAVAQRRHHNAAVVHEFRRGLDRAHVHEIERADRQRGNCEHDTDALGGDEDLLFDGRIGRVKIDTACQHWSLPLADEIRRSKRCDTRADAGLMDAL